MSLETIQTCERCGNRRGIDRKSSPDTGGWRTLNSGSREATFCNNCVKQIVDQAHDAADKRREREAAEWRAARGDT